jgi:DNA polymerase (family 10)
VALNLGAVMDAAVRTGTALEINGSLERLDIRDSYIRYANDKGVMLTMGTDAHATATLGNLEHGVVLARRGWTEARHVLNTRSAEDVLAWTHTPKPARRLV